MTKVTYIDPPSGWKYGFPKVLPDDFIGETYSEWLVENGYPQYEIDSYGKNFFVRLWEENVGDEEE